MSLCSSPWMLHDPAVKDPRVVILNLPKKSGYSITATVIKLADIPSMKNILYLFYKQNARMNKLLRELKPWKGACAGERPVA